MTCEHGKNKDDCHSCHVGLSGHDEPVRHSNLEDPLLVSIIVGILVKKLGGKVSITQEDVDAIAHNRLVEGGLEDGTLFFEVEERKQVG